VKDKYEIDFLNEHTIENIANDFRQEYWNAVIPIDIELIIEKKLKMDLIPVSQMKPDYGIEAFISINMKEIYYDSDTIETRIRFSMAHEVGHMVLHKAIINELRSESYSGYKEKINSLPAKIIDRAELQANSFASYLLIPTSELEMSIENFIHTNKTKFEGLRQILKNVSNENLYDRFSMEIGKVFDVSTQAALVRMSKAKVDLKGKLKEIVGF